MAAVTEEMLARRQELAQQMPTAPLRGEGSCLEMVRYECPVAVLLDPPHRYAQDVLWLEVVACDDAQAAAAARAWVTKSTLPFESMGMVREAGPHQSALGFDHEGRPLGVKWNCPVADETPMATVVRDPITGLRVGFVAHPKSEARWLPEEARGRFRLLARKPGPNSDPAILVPLVRLV